jgi:hypothetical protein
MLVASLHGTAVVLLSIPRHDCYVLVLPVCAIVALCHGLLVTNTQAGTTFFLFSFFFFLFPGSLPVPVPHCGYSTAIN